MPNQNLTMAAAALVLGALLPRAAIAQQAEQFRLSGDRIAIYNLAGELRVEGTTGPDVVVEAVRGGEDRARLRFDRKAVADRQALIVRYPGDRVVYRGEGWRGNTTITVREDGTFFGGTRGGDRVRISGSGRGTEAHADLTVRVPAGKHVALYLAAGRVNISNVDGDLLVDVASASVRAARVKGALNIDTGSGSVRVDGMSGSELRIDTGSGSVDVAGIEAASVLIDTGSGSVRGNGVTARSVNIDTGSGRIDVARVASADVLLDTGSGSVSVGLESDVDRLRIDTGSGSVRVTLPESVGADLEIETGSGGIDVDVPVQTRRSRRGHFSGTVGDGSGRIEIDTGSGGVRVSRG